MRTITAISCCFLSMSGLKSKISFLFVCYMMFMVFIPCADACGIESHEQSVSMETSKDHHQEHLDLCSPFCSCSCCSTQVTVSPLSNLEITKNAISRSFISIDTPFHHALYFSIWQPPKIS